MTNSLTNLLIRLWEHLPFQRKVQLMILMALTVFSSVLEIISIGLVLPFLGALLEPARVLSHPIFGALLVTLGLTSEKNMVMALTMFFCVAALIAGAARLALMWWQTRLSYAVGADFAIGIYRRALHRPYAEHLKINSSETISAVAVKSEIVVRQILFPILTIASSAVTSLAILALLCFANPFITLVTITSFSLIYVCVNYATNSRLSNASKVIDLQSSNVIKAMQDGLGSVRDIIIDGSQDSHMRIYSAADETLRRAQANVLIISQAPRYVIEAGGLIFLGVLAFYLFSQGSLMDSFPALGVLALGLQRLLPVLQHAYAGWACVRGSQQSLETTLNLLDQPLPKEERFVETMPFTCGIEVNRLSYRYDTANPEVLKDVSFNIPKGSSIGIVGKTGSGKSTLLDIFMGLLTPTQGAVCIDGVAIDFSNPRPWHALIAHVPQNIFISDASIQENIAFGIPPSNIDLQRVRDCAAKAQLLEFVNSMPKGFDTIVGERGAWLSGGQRQRLGIARALYKSAQVIVLDEATSALDSDTETSVMNAIDELGPGITLVMVAHRISTLRACQQIIELRDGSVHRVTSYADFSKSIQADVERP